MENPQTPSPFPQSQPINQPPKSKPLSMDGPKVFYYIAAISLINSILFIFNFGFYGSLGITTIVTSIALAIANEAGGGTGMNLLINGIAFAINAVFAGIFAGLGFLSGKRHAWAYVLGMIAYTLDTLLMIWIGDWIEVLIHLYALFLLWRGWSVLRKINAELSRQEISSPSVIE
jgi:hypothetical protein